MTHLNLDDDFDAEGLGAFARLYRDAGPDAALVLFPTRPLGFVTAARDLAVYALNKYWAMRCRETGNIPAALHYEATCDRIFAHLPTFARW